MQNVLDIPHWLAQVFQTLVTLVAGGGIFKVYNSWVNRHRRAAEVSEITVRTRATEGDAVIRLMNRLETALSTVDRLRDERDIYRESMIEEKTKYEELLFQYQQLTTESTLDKQFIEKLQAASKLGIKLSELDKPSS